MIFTSKSNAEVFIWISVQQICFWWHSIQQIELLDQDHLNFPYSLASFSGRPSYVHQYITFSVIYSGTDELLYEVEKLSLNLPTPVSCFLSLTFWFGSCLQWLYVWLMKVVSLICHVKYTTNQNLLMLRKSASNWWNHSKFYIKAVSEGFSLPQCGGCKLHTTVHRSWTEELYMHSKEQLN